VITGASVRGGLGSVTFGAAAAFVALAAGALTSLEAERAVRLVLGVLILAEAGEDVFFAMKMPLIDQN
jgi:hypothetical protein